MSTGNLSKGFGDTSILKAIDGALNGLSGLPVRFAVALSGGADSAMLAAHAVLVAQQRGIELHCFHVHHGLQSHADVWQTHVHDLCQLLRVGCHSVCIEVKGAGRDGIESAARDARYASLAGLAEHVGVDTIMLAHHRDDQAETVLLRLLRGAGPTGLAAMSPESLRQGVRYLRPLLDIDRARILEQAERFSQLTGWRPVHDPTNSDDAYTRAAVRERLAPHLNERWPGWQGILARHARQTAETAQVLDEVAAVDFSGLEPDSEQRSFSLAAWRRLSPPRQALVLRYWLAQVGLRMPSDARLHDLMRQMRGLHALGHDRQMRVKHGGHFVCCTRGRVFLE
ncbi:tRNA lysidine(34) synthetase TilS [Pusillimonas sp. ANT_WB101]|uniref:tRNA lysidine(34) synthetase TilS n=1 Tax=Pusillimonas sp. ANT_WB101 TaxID=2597356 RepID=UPI0011ED54EB|nr:tRNA lysidine(34) synthetase TilS [Pusillimonas sp. ANT_WB101]KAA0910507.1 tRNA lysidine(34) synthetase TilS [Pusillimonas sp. ANT_WB101]